MIHTNNFKFVFRTVLTEVRETIHAGKATQRDLDKLRFFLGQSIHYDLDTDLVELRFEVRYLADQIESGDDEIPDVPVELFVARLKSVFTRV